jgi:hypothetical protein
MDGICRQSNCVYASSFVFTIFKKNEKPATCEMWCVIHFFNARNMKLADIHYPFCEVYGEHAMSDSTVWRWIIHFDEHKNVHDDLRSSRPSVVNEDLVRIVEEKIQENRQFIISSLFHKFHSHFFTQLCLINFVFRNCVHSGI